MRHLGSGVVVFGDGPDGGREATYSGSPSFAPHGRPWDGYTVLQAKFRQRPLVTEKDGPWAVAELKSELKKFAEHKGGPTSAHELPVRHQCRAEPGSRRRQGSGSPSSSVRGRTGGLSSTTFGTTTSCARSSTYGTGSDRAGTVIDRLHRAIGNHATLHLMRSPLQVAIMTALVDRFGQPPHERWRLFHRYYEVIYQRERERERDTDAALILSEYEPDINAIHQRVGLTLQLLLTTHEEHADPRLSGAELARIVDARLGQEGHPAARAAALSERIRSAAELRLVFLVGAQEDRIGFEIRSLRSSWRRVPWSTACPMRSCPDCMRSRRCRAGATS